MIRKTMTLGGREFSIETGRMAKQANGAVVVRYGDTMVLVTATSDFNKEMKQDFFPLMCEYRDKTYAAGKIPGGFFKREGRSSEKETLASRLIDRPIRPLFEEGFFCDTQIIANCISSDKENTGDVLAITGASAALSVSDVPFLGPIAGVRVGLVDGEFVLNPTISQMEQSELEIVVAGDENSVVMVEGEAKEISEEMMVDAINFGQKAIQELVAFQKELVAEINPVKYEVTPPELPEGLEEKVRAKTTPMLPKFRELGLQKKKLRSQAIADFVKELKAELEEEYPDEAGTIFNIFDDVMKEDARDQIVKDGVRLDGRKLTEVRPITCETGVLPRTHGSALFTRGETQSLGTVTLGTKLDEQIIDDIDGEQRKRFMLHYNFPPFSVGEVRPMRGPGRREIGHGNLAERALKAIAPVEEDFPYTMRIVSEILESNGSSSMATVCSGSLAMMDAGVPIPKTVAGIAMGLIKNEDDFFVLTDILGSEDHFGDMDFKVAGTKDGINAIQMDLKVNGISSEIMTKALAQAKEGRMHIIGIMESAMEAPREKISEYAPCMLTIKVPNDYIGEIIGPGGKRIRELQERTETTIAIEDDGSVFISALSTANAEAARDHIAAVIEEPEEGKIYKDCEVKRLEDYGAFVEIIPGKDGLLHISEVAWERTNSIHDVLKVGDKVDVKLLKIAAPGKLELSLRELTEKPEGWEPPKPRKSFSRDNRDRGDRGGRPRNNDRRNFRNNR